MSILAGRTIPQQNPSDGMRPSYRTNSPAAAEDSGVVLSNKMKSLSVSASEPSDRNVDCATAHRVHKESFSASGTVELDSPHYSPHILNSKMRLVFFVAVLFATMSSVLCAPVAIQPQTYDEVAAAPAHKLDAFWKRSPARCVPYLAPQYISLHSPMNSPLSGGGGISSSTPYNGAPKIIWGIR